MSDLEDKTPEGASEPPASRTTPEEAEAINSDVRRPVQSSEPIEKQPSEKLDEGSGNRTAPHETKTSTNKQNDKKGSTN